MSNPYQATLKVDENGHEVVAVWPPQWRAMTKELDTLKAENAELRAKIGRIAAAVNGHHNGCMNWASAIYALDEIADTLGKPFGTTQKKGGET